MERTLSSEERIRRAEEIYQRRKMQGGVRVSGSSVNSKGKNDYLLFKKLGLQIAICVLIYFIFYLIQNSNYIFSENVIGKTKEFLSYDINFQSVFEQIGDYYNKNIAVLFSNENKEKEEEKDNNENEENNENTTNQNEIIQENQETKSQENIVNESNENKTNEIENGIGGGEEGENLLTNEITQEASADEQPAKELTQMEIDANEIKRDYSFIVPLKGTISSRFGPRTASTIVSANHAGIDIAANEGTIFIAAMEGKVTFISKERRLWKPCIYRKK